MNKAPAKQSDAEHFCALLGIPLDVLDRADFRYLEKRGYRFCVHFGTENAARIRDSHYDYERAEKSQFLRRDQVPDA